MQEAWSKFQVCLRVEGLFLCTEFAVLSERSRELQLDPTPVLPSTKPRWKTDQGQRHQESIGEENDFFAS